MPNWVRNVVTVSKDTMNKIKEKYFENGILDFNKIIPIPKTLELTEGSITDVAIYYALLQKNENKQYEIIKALSKKEDYIYNNYSCFLSMKSYSFFSILALYFCIQYID